MVLNDQSNKIKMLKEDEDNQGLPNCKIRDKKISKKGQ